MELLVELQDVSCFRRFVTGIQSEGIKLSDLTAWLPVTGGAIENRLLFFFQI